MRVWIEPASHKTVGDGIVPKAAQFTELLAWKPDLLLVDSGGIGEKADIARNRGIPVVGGGAFCDKLEEDRTFGMGIAQQIGARIPGCKEFATLRAAADYAKTLGNTPTYFKSDRYLEGDATHGAPDGAQMHDYLEDLMRQYG